MQVTKVSLGHTTNSSSSHSIVILGANNSIDDIFPQPLGGILEYGWENFMLTSPLEKNKYLFAQLHIALSKVVGPTTRDIVLSKLFGDLADSYQGEECYIDHQSVMSFPCEFGSNTLDLDFVKEFNNFVRRDDVVVLGGNDNEGSVVVPNTKRYFDNALVNYYSSKLVCRKDDGGWTLFNRDSGATITMNFSDEKPVKYKTPLIADISVTDFCGMGCKFCYRGSTVNGKHARMYDISKIVKQLEGMKVFSVAIGGGEPTTHPEFEYILSRFKTAGINVSFTTRSTSWMLNKNIREAVDKYVSAVGFSVSTGQEVVQLAQSCEIANFPMDKIILHAVVGVSDIYACKYIVRCCERYGFGGVLFLGYKTTGRGKSVKPVDVNLIKVFKDSSGVDISIDTCLADKWQKELNKSGVPKVLYSIREGVSSCFIDAVNLKIAQSSFGGKEEKFVLDFENDNSIFEAWKKIKEEV